MPFIVLDRGPSHNRRLNTIDNPIRHKQQSDAFRTEQILVSIGGERINIISFDVELQTAEPLYNIDDKDDVALAAELADLRQIRSKTTGELNPADRHHPSAVVD